MYTSLSVSSAISVIIDSVNAVRVVLLKKILA